LDFLRNVFSKLSHLNLQSGDSRRSLSAFETKLSFRPDFPRGSAGVISIENWSPERDFLEHGPNAVEAGFSVKKVKRDVKRGLGEKTYGYFREQRQEILVHHLSANQDPLQMGLSTKKIEQGYFSIKK